MQKITSCAEALQYLGELVEFTVEDKKYKGMFIKGQDNTLYLVHNCPKRDGSRCDVGEYSWAFFSDIYFHHTYFKDITVIDKIEIGEL